MEVVRGLAGGRSAAGVTAAAAAAVIPAVETAMLVGQGTLVGGWSGAGSAHVAPTPFPCGYLRSSFAGWRLRSWRPLPRWPINGGAGGGSASSPSGAPPCQWPLRAARKRIRPASGDHAAHGAGNACPRRPRSVGAHASRPHSVPRGHDGRAQPPRGVVSQTRTARPSCDPRDRHPCPCCLLLCARPPSPPESHPRAPHVLYGQCFQARLRAMRIMYAPRSPPTSTSPSNRHQLFV